METLLTIDEVAARLRCSRSTIERRVANGDFPVFRSGRIVRILGSCIDEEFTAARDRAAPSSQAGVGFPKHGDERSRAIFDDKVYGKR